MRRVRRWFSRSEWAIRRLKLATHEEVPHAPGLLLIQMDGFSRKQMEKAMKAGRLPFLQSLFHRQHYELWTFYSGLPATTPAVQGELHYGIPCAVPSFSFLDRSTTSIGKMFNPASARKVESLLQKKGEGLLAHGSSWSNIYTGGCDAQDSHFCASSIGFGDIFKTATIPNTTGIILLQIASVLRIVTFATVEFVVAASDFIRGVRHGEDLASELKALLSRILVTVGLREVITVGAQMDLARGLPIIHVNYLGYDEQAHRRGPESAFAHWSLKGIDHAIRRLYGEARRATRRDYEVWVFSDHGQERSRSYLDQHPEGIESAVRDALLESQLHPDETARLHSMQRRLPGSRARWALPSLSERLKQEYIQEEQLTEEEERTFFVTAMGPVGHVYLSRVLQPVQLDRLARCLVEKKHVPGVLVREEDGKAKWFHRRGVHRMPEEADKVLVQEEPLRQEVAADLVRLCHHPWAGDLVLLGWSPDESSLSFPPEHGAHAGPGPNETQGFALLPPKTRLPRPHLPYIRPHDLRAAALHLLDRQSLPSPKPNRRQGGDQYLRVMTYNVHSCMGLDGRISPKRIARIIQTHEPEIVGLQEIDLGRARSRNEDQAAIIAQELGMHAAFCPTVCIGEEWYGHAIFSRFPIQVIRNTVFPPSSFHPQGEPRGALWVKFDLETTRLHFINTHFGLRRLERLEQVETLLGKDWIGQIPESEPLILCGDFNMLPNSQAYQMLTARLRDVQMPLPPSGPLNTFASAYPFSRIDHVFISRPFDVEKIVVPQTHLTRVASDHLPLVVDLLLHLNS